MPKSKFIKASSGVAIISFIPVLAWSTLGGTALFAMSRAVVFDGLALVLGLLTLFVSAITLSFASRYMRADPRPALFQLSVVALIASVLVFLFSTNLIAIGLGWLASGWLLARLIGHSRSVCGAAEASRKALYSFIIGDAALLLAFVIIASWSGQVDLSGALTGAADMPATVSETTAMLLLVAAAVRCALPPFSGWLLSSMTAPTPVSALMHAGLVNAGGFLLIRFAPVLENAPLTRFAALALGLLSALYGIGIMMVRPDVKRSLAGSTISQMGFMIMSCGLGAYAAALWHLVAHGLFKAWLFLGAGSAIGMRDGTQSSALTLQATLPIAVGAIVATLALIQGGYGQANLIPLLLGLTTAVSALAACLGGRLPMRAKLALLVAVAALIACHTAGLTLALAAAGPDADALVPNWAVLTIMAALLGLWVWQQQLLSRGFALPFNLYVHLMNAGSLPAPGKGDAQ